MDFWRAVEVLGRRKWLILLSVVVAMGLTLGATRLTGSKWTATVRMVTPAATPAQTVQGTGPTAPPDQLARAQQGVFSALLTSSDVLRPALKEAKIADVPADLIANVKFELAGPQLFELQVTDSSPARAQALANALADNLVIRSKHKLYTEESQRLVTLLQEQIDDADKRLDEAKRRYDRYRDQNNIAGELNDSLVPALANLQGARQQRDDAQQRLSEARARLAEKRSELASLPKTVDVTVENPLIKALEEKLAKAEADLIEKERNYYPVHPEVKTAKQIRDHFQTELNNALKRAPRIREEPNPEAAPVRQAIAELKSEISGFQAQIAELDRTIGKVRGELKTFTSASGELGILSTELAQLTEARTALAARLQSALLAQDAQERQKPIEVVDHVSEFNPPVNTTAGRTSKLLVLAALCAFVGTSGLVIGLDSIDRRLRNVGEAERALPAPVVAAIPQAMGGVTQAAMARATELHPLSLHSEAYRFLGLHLLSARGRRIRSLMALSAKADQGSTNTVTNLGITLAQAGQRVVIVDANMRTPHVHSVFGLDNEFGFTDLLRSPDAGSLERALRPTLVPNLRVITSGTLTENPWELFRSDNMLELAQRLRDLADYVLFDTPSALAFTDALNLAPAVDAAFLCVRALEAPSGAEQRLVELLEQSNVTVLGSVLSDVPASVLDSYTNYLRYYPSSASTPVVSQGSELVATGGNGSGWINGNGHGHSNGLLGDRDPVHGDADRGA